MFRKLALAAAMSLSALAAVVPTAAASAQHYSGSDGYSTVRYVHNGRHYDNRRSYWAARERWENRRWQERRHNRWEHNRRDRQHWDRHDDRRDWHRR